MAPAPALPAGADLVGAKIAAKIFHQLIGRNRLDEQRHHRFRHKTMRLSGLQKEVLALYRQCLRECRRKPQLVEQSTRAHFEKFVRDEFSRNLAIDKRDFAAVEFLLRKGHRQLDVYSSPGIKDIRRSSRAHTPILKQPSPPASPGSVYSSDMRQDPQQYAEVSSHGAHKKPSTSFHHAQADIRTTAEAKASFRGVSMRSLDAASSVDNSWEPSELSLDLDSFPIPPLKVPPRKPVFAGSASATLASPPQSRATALPNPKPSACLPKMGFSSPQTRRKSHVYMPKSPRSPHNWLLDGTADFVSATKHASIDAALVEAISRSVCQQLRLFNAISKNNQDKMTSRASKEAPTSRHKDPSRVPNRSNSLERLSGRRHGQPEAAVGPRQLSPLLPFRPEFRAAGLAVTSKDQKRNFPAYIARLISSKSSRKQKGQARGKQPKVSRFDGFDEQDSSPSSMSELSFAASQDMDEWRHALIEEAPVRKQKRRPDKAKKKSKRHWFSCFPKDEESSRGIPSQAIAPPNVPMRTSSIPDSFSTPEDGHEGESDVIDRDVLRGLHIAASAACDEEVDTFVRNKTGLRLRRFLADLMVLETLRDVQPDQGNGPGARRKKSTLRKLKQQVRRSREIGELGMVA
ncbi:hypothetical protein MKX08_000640 [Trichoderma sp. CBMAI-0020]|nr:hypothetical protein MKX08_000640 [Trichoderma sp. CBMAI-0020]WOD46256.1 hypothetical protein [Trichoderma atroviride]